jgi:hypothetical protein
MRTAVLSFVLLAIGGCASQPSFHETPPTPPRAKPSQALQACRTQSAVDACKFRPEFVRLSLADQLGMVRNCIEVTGAVMWECSAKRDRLAEWISAD